MESFLSQFAVGFNSKWNKVGMWVPASFFLFSAEGAVVGGRCGVGGCSGGTHWVDDGDVDVVGSGVVVTDDVEAGLFVLWCVVVAVEFRNVDFELGVVAVLVEPFL